LEKPQNVGALLTNARVYVLTGSRTASASELIINGLRPYMQVYLVGNKTLGKNMGSISLYNEEDPENTWGMQPIVTKLVNSEGKSDYESGFTPQLPNADNSLYIHPLGDPKETLLNLTLQQITGLSSIGRMRGPDGPSLGEPIAHSLDLKKRSGRLLLDAVR
jgi:C-terminal processing protease CtpA/Prc